MSLLFESGKINNLVLKNRFVRSATWTGMADKDGAVTDEMIGLMASLSRGGVGLMITGHAYVHADGKHVDRQLGLDRDKLIPGLENMTRAVHDQGGLIAAQLGYGGFYLSRSRVTRMSRDDMRDSARYFAEAALRARKSGFDAVQIFAAHGFFLSQLLCPRYNLRTDEYGGPIENRVRLLLQVLADIRDLIGADYPVLVKLNCRDFIEDGLTLEDSLEVARMLERGGADAIELSGSLLNVTGVVEKRIRAEDDEAFFKDEAIAFKKEIGLPLILTGGIRSFETAERLLEEGAADFIGLSRPFIREPDLVARWQRGDLGRARCISCSNCFEPLRRGAPVACVPLEEPEEEPFFPQESVDIPASSPHPPGACYRVSKGLEEMQGAYIPVVKVQIVENGQVTRKAPSFPLGSEDYVKVMKAVDDFSKG